MNRDRLPVVDREGAVDAGGGDNDDVSFFRLQ
jgi:hypothetical protein